MKKEESWKSCKHKMKLMWNEGEPYLHCSICDLNYWYSNSEKRFTNEEIVAKFKEEYPNLIL